MPSFGNKFVFARNCCSPAGQDEDYTIVWLSSAPVSRVMQVINNRDAGFVPRKRQVWLLSFPVWSLTSGVVYS